MVGPLQSLVTGTNQSLSVPVSVFLSGPKWVLVSDFLSWSSGVPISGFLSGPCHRRLRLCLLCLLDFVITGPCPVSWQSLSSFWGPLSFWPSLWVSLLTLLVTLDFCSLSFSLIPLPLCPLHPPDSIHFVLFPGFILPFFPCFILNVCYTCLSL